jgi:hypothetical protein
MNRAHSRGEIRKRAMLAFARRNRMLTTPRGMAVYVPVRDPEFGETPLSDSEVWHGLQRGLIGNAA